MYEPRPVTCPHCDKKGLPKVWMGLNPPHCSNCGKAMPQKEIKLC